VPCGVFPGLAVFSPYAACGPRASFSSLISGGFRSRVYGLGPVWPGVYSFGQVIESFLPDAAPGRRALGMSPITGSSRWSRSVTCSFCSGCCFALPLARCLVVAAPRARGLRRQPSLSENEADTASYGGVASADFRQLPAGANDQAASTCDPLGGPSSPAYRWGVRRQRQTHLLRTTASIR